MDARPAPRIARPSLPNTAVAGAVVALAMALVTGPAWAQYKVVGPDGRVTYTDRPPSDAGARVESLGRSGAVGGEAGTDTASANPPLPAELQRIGTRFPVTLYSSRECAPCDSGRTLLQQRGVPYSERQVLTADDVSTLERLTGARSLPALTIGAQVLRGYSETDWTAYLDAAGYPRESRLPRGWTPPAPAPLVARAPLPAPAPPSPPAPAPEARGDGSSSGGIRF